MNYFILSESMMIVLPNQNPISLAKDHPKFEEVKSLLIESKFTEAKEVIDSVQKNDFNLEYKDGSFFFQGTQIPSFLTDYIQTNKELGKSLINFWLNMTKKHDEETTHNICQELIVRKFFPLSKDGFIIGYDESNHSYQSKSYLNNSSVEKEVFFYNIHSLPEELYLKFKGAYLEDTIESLFKSSSKKLLNIIRTKCFPKKENHIRFDYLIYSYCLESVLNENNTISFMEKAKGNDLSIGHAKMLNNFLKEISLEKDQKTYNQKKVINFLDSVIWTQVNSFVNFYEIFKHNVNVDIRTLELKNNFTEVYQYLKDECAKFNNTKVEKLHTELNFPELSKLHNETFGNLQIIVPETNIDLIEWTNKMGNCIHSFASSVKSGSTFVFAIIDIDSGQMMYNVEIMKGRIKQLERVRKTKCEPSVRKSLTKLLVSKGLIFG